MDIEEPQTLVIDGTWERCTNEYDPDRCQGVNGGNQGQCWFKVSPESKFCPRHGGRHAAAAEKKEKVRNYHLGKWRERVNQFADNPEIKSLREEIGIVRMLIEAVIEKCNDTTDLLMVSGKLQALIFQAQKLVSECHRLEERTGVLLDKQTILIVCDSLVRVIGTYVEDSDALESISRQMVEIVAKVGGLADVTANVNAPAGAN